MTIAILFLLLVATLAAMLMMLPREFRARLLSSAGRGPERSVGSAILAIFKVAGAVIALVTIFQVLVELDTIRDDREVRRIDRLEAAWSRLLFPAGGNIGKGEALNQLVRQGVSLDGIDLSCAQVGAWRDGKGCASPAFFDNVHVGYRPAEQDDRRVWFRIAGEWIDWLIRKPTRKNWGGGASPGGGEYGTTGAGGYGVVNIMPDVPTADQRGRRYPGYTPLYAEGISFAGNVIRYAKINDVHIEHLNLMEARIWDSDLHYNAFVQGNFRHLRIGASDLSFSEFSGDLRGMNISDTNISDTAFTPEQFSSEPGFGLPNFGAENWAWADVPPRFLVHVVEGTGGDLLGRARDAIVTLIGRIKLCDPRIRNAGQVSPEVEEELEELKSVQRYKLAPQTREEVERRIEFLSLRAQASGGGKLLRCDALTLEVARNRFPAAYRAAVAVITVPEKS